MAAAAAAAPFGSFEHEDEEEEMVPEDEIQERLGDSLKDINSAGLFAFHKQLKDAPNPGISIEGAGAISFPLRAADISVIYGTSRCPEPENRRYGRKVPAEQVKIGNPSWQRLVSKVLGTVVEQLGVDEERKGIVAAGPSLILYEPGNLVP